MVLAKISISFAYYFFLHFTSVPKIRHLQFAVPPCSCIALRDAKKCCHYIQYQNFVLVY